MRCDRFRDAMSARLDGEPLGTAPSTLDAHLASCPDCARWTQQATALTRRVRLDVQPVPDLTDEIVARVALPVRRVLRRRFVLRVLMVLVGVVQLGIGIPALAGDSLGMEMAVHAAHEAAAWNLALAAAFLAAASAPRRAAGLVPMLGTFLLVLTVLSVRDLASGAVGYDRLATHLAALVGLVLLIALDRAERALPPAASSGSAGTQRDSGDGGSLRTVA